MKVYYLLEPDNPNLGHCCKTFSKAIHFASKDDSQKSIYICRFNFEFIGSLIKKLYNQESNIELFFFAPRFKYIGLISFLRLTSLIFKKRVFVYYMMHEPRYLKNERRSSLIKSFLLFRINILLSYLSDIIFLPSIEAVSKAKSFVQPEKMVQLNLTFETFPKHVLESNLSQLKCLWFEAKTFSSIGTMAKDRNPMGFLSFANLAYRNFGVKAKFIRAGRDLGLDIDYQDFIIQFPGYITENAKRFLFDISHFIVVPYYASTQSGVVTEALSHGKLLILNDIPAFSYLKEYEFAFFADFNNESSILSCIQRIANLEVEDYERRFWKAVSYFNDHHSEQYLIKTLNSLPV